MPRINTVLLLLSHKRSKDFAVGPIGNTLPYSIRRKDFHIGTARIDQLLYLRRQKELAFRKVSSVSFQETKEHFLQMLGKRRRKAEAVHRDRCILVKRTDTFIVKRIDNGSIRPPLDF